MTDKNRDDDQNDGGNDPLGNLFGMFFGPGGAQFGGAGGAQFGGAGGQGLPFDPAMLGGIMQQLQGLLGGGSQAGAMKAAEQSIPTPDPAIGPEAARATADAFRLAELWLENVTSPAAGLAEPQALTRRQWVERTFTGWQRMLAPIQTNMSQALSSSIAQQAPEELRPMLAGAGQMFTSMSDSMFGMQLGEALGGLSGTVLSGTEFGLPLMDTAHPVLVESNITGAAAELGVEPAELRIYLAVRELAHLWLFARAPWLAGHVETALTKYAAGIELDLERIQGLATSSFDPSSLEQLSEEVRQGMFNPRRTESQQQALTSLQNLLSVIAGWADVVSYAACAQLGGRDAIREALRVRQTTQGAADKSFAELIGLELTPSRIRDAAALFSYLEQSEDAAARDAVFSHPDLLPTTQDLDDPLGYRERRQQDWSGGSSMDEALARLLAESTAEFSDDEGIAGLRPSSDEEAGDEDPNGHARDEDSSGDANDRGDADDRDGGTGPASS